MAQLVFIHGAADSGSVWELQVAHFRAGHEVVAVDLPGHGARLDELALERVEENAEEVLRLLRAQGLDAPVLVGHSMGGATALALAIAYPEVPRGLVLVGSGARLRMRPEPIQEARVRAQSALPGQRIPRVIPLDRILSPAASAQSRQWLEQRFGESTAQATYADFLATHGFDVMGRLEEISLPVLIVGGEDDVWTPPKFQHYLAEHLPGSELILLPRVGHYPFVEAAETFNRAVEAFLRALPPS